MWNGCVPTVVSTPEYCLLLLLFSSSFPSSLHSHTLLVPLTHFLSVPFILTVSILSFRVYPPLCPSPHYLTLTHLLLLFLMRPPTDPHPNPNPTTHAHTPLSAREQQLSLWALKVWGGVVSVLLPNAPPAVRDAACAVLDSRDVYSHWENELGGVSLSRWWWLMSCRPARSWTRCPPLPGTLT